MLLMLVTGTTQGVAQNVTIDLDHGSLLAAVTDENESGFAQGYRALWRHEQLALSMTGTDRDGLTTSGEVLEPSAVFGQRNGKITIVGGRRPSYIVVSLPKGYRITGYTLVLANDLVGANVGTGDFRSINDNDEPLNNGQTATMRFYETKKWPDNETNSGHASRTGCNSAGYNENQVRYIETGTDWQNGQIGQDQSDILATAANGDDIDINPSDAGKKYTISRTSQSPDDMGNQIYFRLVKNYCFYGLTIESFEIRFTAEGTFTANVKPAAASNTAVSMDASPFKTNKIDIGEMKNHTQPGSNNQAFSYTWEEVKDLDAFNYIYQDDALKTDASLGGKVPADEAGTKNIYKVNHGGALWYGLKNDVYFVEPPIEIENSAHNMVPIGYRIVGGAINYALGSEDYFIQLYDRTGAKITTADGLIEVNSSNATGSIDLGILNNDAIKFEILRKNADDELVPFSESGMAYITVDLYLQALNPYIDKMDIVCHDKRDVLQLTQTFTADNFSVAGDRFIFYVPEDYGREDLTFTFSGLYSKYGDETYYDRGEGSARYSFVRSPYFIPVDGNGNKGLYDDDYSPDASYTNKVFTSNAGKYRFKFNNAEDLAAAGNNATGTFTEYPFSVKTYLNTKNPGDKTAYYPVDPSEDKGEFIDCVLNASIPTQKSGTYYVFTADETRYNIAPTDGWQHRYYAFYRMEIELVAKTFTPDLKYEKIYPKTFYNDGTGDKEDSMWGLTLDVSDKDDSGQKVEGYLTYQEIIDHIIGRDQQDYQTKAECNAVNARLGGFATGAKLTAEQASAVNAVSGMSKEYGVDDELSEDDAYLYNTTKVNGAVKIGDEKYSEIASSLDENNENAPASMKQLLYIDGTPLYAMVNSSDGADIKTLNDLKAELNPNALVFLPENTTSTLENVAYETTSTSSTTELQAGGNIVLTDKIPFYTPYDIQVDAANYASYTRKLTKSTYATDVEYATVFMPFTISLSSGQHTDADYGTMEFMQMNTTKATSDNYFNYGPAFFFSTTNADKVEANTPYALKIVNKGKSTDAFTLRQSGANIVATPKKDVLFSNKNITSTGNLTDKYGATNEYSFTHVGTFSGGKVAKEQKLFYFASNGFYSSVELKDKYTTVDIYPFRSVYQTNGSGSAKVGFLMLAEGENPDMATGITDVDKVFTGITTGKGFISITTDADTAYRIRTVSGQNIDALNLKAGESRTVYVPAGIYLVNGLKVLVK